MDKNQLIFILGELQRYCHGESQPLTKSESLRSIFDGKAKESYRKVLSTLVRFSDIDLEKSVKPVDWNRILRSHDESQPMWVDPTQHLAENPAPSHYQNLLKDLKPIKGEKVQGTGVSAKMIHKVPGPDGTDTVMAKPYFKAIESHSRGWVKRPILGWSTMATKALYNAGKIGHLCEDVSTHQHEGVPLTVHKFSADHKEVMNLRDDISNNSVPINHLNAKQIALMDFLTDNNDRHMGNLMVGDLPDETGKHPILAIDHERSFQYHERPSSGIHTPFKNAMAGGLNDVRFQTARFAGNEYQSRVGGPGGKQPEWYETDNDLAKWWTDNRDNMKAELEKQLSSIKDEKIRNHIRDNFHSRAAALGGWADEANRFGAENLGEVLGPNSSAQAAHIPFPEDKDRISALAGKLPDKPLDAVHTVAASMMRKDRLDPLVKNALTGALRGIIGKASPEELVELEKTLRANPLFKTKLFKTLGIRGMMVDHLNADESDLHRQAFIQHYESLPEGEEKNYWKMFLPHWAKKQADKVQEQEPLSRAEIVRIVTETLEKGFIKKLLAQKAPEAAPVANVPAPKSTEKLAPKGAVTKEIEGSITPADKYYSRIPGGGRAFPHNSKIISSTPIKMVTPMGTVEGWHHIASGTIDNPFSSEELNNTTKNLYHAISLNKDPNGLALAMMHLGSSDGKKYHVRGVYSSASNTEMKMSTASKWLDILKNQVKGSKYPYHEPVALNSEKHMEKGWENHNPELVHGLVPDVSLQRHPGSITPWLSFATTRGGKKPRVIAKEAFSSANGLNPDKFESSGFSHPTFTTAHREAAYSKLADSVFGLGKYVPKVAVFRHPLSNKPWSAMKFIPGGVEPASWDGITDLGSELRQKLGLMNVIMGNQDRHGGNTVVDKYENLHLIDNALSFDYAGIGGHEIPKYVRDGAAMSGVNEKTKDWLLKLDPKKFANELKDSGAPEDTIKYAVMRMVAAQKWVKDGVGSRFDVLLAHLLSRHSISSEGATAPVPKKRGLSDMVNDSTAEEKPVTPPKHPLKGNTREWMGDTPQKVAQQESYSPPKFGFDRKLKRAALKGRTSRWLKGDKE